MFTLRQTDVYTEAPSAIGPFWRLGHSFPSAPVFFTLPRAKPVQRHPAARGGMPPLKKPPPGGFLFIAAKVRRCAMEPINLFDFVGSGFFLSIGLITSRLSLGAKAPAHAQRVNYIFALFFGLTGSANTLGALYEGDNRSVYWGIVFCIIALFFAEAYFRIRDRKGNKNAESDS
jgi:hypothetical protein